MKFPELKKYNVSLDEHDKITNFYQKIYIEKLLYNPIYIYIKYEKNIDKKKLLYLLNNYENKKDNTGYSLFSNIVEYVIVKNKISFSFNELNDIYKKFPLNKSVVEAINSKQFLDFPSCKFMYDFLQSREINIEKKKLEKLIKIDLKNKIKTNKI